MKETLFVKKLSLLAELPARGEPDAAGLDVRACLPDGAKGIVIPGLISLLRKIGPQLQATELNLDKDDECRRVIPTGLAMRCPEGTYVRAAPRSGLAVKQGVDVLAGVVDIGYTGEVGIVLINTGLHDIVINHGDRIAQLILERISMAAPAEVAELPKTIRGDGAYGSTGNH